MSFLFSFTTAMPFASNYAWTATKIAIVFLALINIKSLPFTWHFRFYRSLYTHFILRRSILPEPAHLFSPITTTSRSSTYECDLNGHKSNSTYFSDLDIARTHLLCHLTKHAFAQRKKRGEPAMYVALAGVTALFRREIKPGQKYIVSSRVLGWDGKWMWVASHFVSPEKGKDGGPRTLFASCLSKYVFKINRRTVAPEVVLRESGLLPERPEGVEALSSGSSGVGTPVGLKEGHMGEERLEEVVERMRRRVGEDARGALEEGQQQQQGAGYWTWERIEKERQRGVELAGCMLGLDGLAEEFREGDEEGLSSIGKFYGGW